MSARNRTGWQEKANTKGANAEKLFYQAFDFGLSEEFIIDSKPKDFNNLYQSVELSDQTLSEIYTPDKKITRHGISPDYAIRNLNTGKSLFVEVKRQDGWVEGGVRADGRGNAHERCLKYFAPGLIRSLREASGIEAPALPFWVVFQGNITRDPCRVREVSLWFEGVEEHMFMWRPAHGESEVLEHFNNNLKGLLE